MPLAEMPSELGERTPAAAAAGEDEEEDGEEEMDL